MTYPPYNPQPYGNYGPPQVYAPRVDPYMQQQPTSPVLPTQPPTQGLSASSRPVTNREEAMGVAADFTGAPMVFPDITHDRVYIKRWNFNAGAADFNEYVRVPPAAPQEQDAPRMQFATVQDVADLKDNLEQLKSELERLKQRPAAVSGKAGKKDE